MLRCSELSNLSKGRSLKSINFRATTPGSPGALITYELPFRLDAVVDPTHPATALSRAAHRTFPNIRTDALGVRAFPKALLTRPEVYYPDPPYRRAKVLSWEETKGLEAEVPLRKAKQVDMSMLCVVGKKNVHKKAVIRKKIVTKLKTAISLIVTRGANIDKVATIGDHKSGETRLTFHEDDGKEWILSDWTYIFYPTLSIYRMPYPELIALLRNVLDTIRKRGLRMEQTWRMPVEDVKQVKQTKGMDSEKQRRVTKASHGQAAKGTRDALAEVTVLGARNRLANLMSVPTRSSSQRPDDAIFKKRSLVSCQPPDSSKPTSSAAVSSRQRAPFGLCRTIPELTENRTSSSSISSSSPGSTSPPPFPSLSSFPKEVHQLLPPSVPSSSPLAHTQSHEHQPAPQEGEDATAPTSRTGARLFQRRPVYVAAPLPARKRR